MLRAWADVEPALRLSIAKSVTARFEIQGARYAEVLFENRKIDAKDGIIDDFGPNGVHVYRLR